MTAAWPICVIVLVLDAAIFSLMLDIRPSDRQFVAFSIAHTTACLLFSPALVTLLPDYYRRPAFASSLFVFTTVIFIPVLGMIGLLACIVPALRGPRLAGRFSECQHPSVFNLPTLPVEPRGMCGIPRAGELAGRLQHDADPKKRIASLIATLSLEDQYAVPLLRLALKDSEDDVRLLAYALLNRKEKAIEERIRDQSVQAGSDTPAQIFSQHKALAHEYWALANLVASHGRTLPVLCARAHEHVQAALQHCPQDGGLQFLFGRILLIEGQLDAASDAFVNAKQSGIDARQIAPFLAEIAYLARQYSDVKNHLIRAGNGCSQPRLNKSSTYWKESNDDVVRT